MILTLTPHAALDRIIFIDQLRPGTPMRSPKMIDKVGGKGLDASVTLRTLGVETVALSFVAGERGQRLANLLDDYGIAHDLIWLAGETRLSHVIVETGLERHSHVIVGKLPLTSRDTAELLERIRRHLPRADWIVAAGSLPPGAPPALYRTVTDMAHQAGVLTLIDATGPAGLAAVPARPTILKMNRHEFSQTFALTVDSLDEIKKHAQTVFERESLAALVLTCGAQGILAVTSSGAYRATSPVQKAVNAAGAGDAVSAALVWQLSNKATWAEALRWAAAVGAATVLTEGTADSHMADIERILPQVKVEQFAD